MSRSGTARRETAVIICPGRGTYNRSELGYLARHFFEPDGVSPAIQDFLAEIDEARIRRGQIGITELDGADRYTPRIHGTGDNASALIHACALADFQTIDLERYEIVAVTGNSMGWYLALACAGVLPGLSGFEVVNTMGVLMHEHGRGGQVIYPLVDANWQSDPDQINLCEQTMTTLNQEDDVEIHTSIRLGGMVVFAANDKGVSRLLETLPPCQDRYPFALPHHSAFHSPLLDHIPAMAVDRLDRSLFQPAGYPLVDGTGRIWQPLATSSAELYDYTFHHQITETYDFTRAIEVCLKEFAPDRLIVLGPGSTLGPPVAQVLIDLEWDGLRSKPDFQRLQEESPVLLAMGIEEQRRLVVSS